MERDEVLKKFTDVIKNETDDYDLEIDDDTVAADVDDWDSLAHLSIVHEVEDSFGIKLTMGEIQDSANVGEFVDAIKKHLDEK